MPAAAYDTSTYAHYGDDGAGAVGTATQAHTVAAGGSLWVAVGMASALGVNCPALTVAVTYNGVSMTASLRQNPSGSTSASLATFYRLNCGDGASHNIVVTLTGGTCLLMVGAISGTDVDSIGTPTGVNGIATNSPACNVTGVTANDFVVGAAIHGAGITASSNTQRWLENLTGNSAGSNASGGTSASTGTVNMAWTSASSDHWQIVGVALQGSAAAAVADDASWWLTRTGPGLVAPPGRLLAVVDYDGDANGVTAEDHPTSGGLYSGELVVADVTHGATVSAVMAAGATAYANVTRTAAVAALLAAAPTSYTTISRTADITALVAAGVVPYATVTRTADIAALLAAGVVPYATATRTANVTGLLTAGGAVFAIVGASADITTTGLLAAGAAAYATATRTATVTALLAGGGVPYASVSRTATVVGLMTAGGIVTALITASGDISTTGLGIAGATARAGTITHDATPAAILPAGSAQQSPVTRTASVTGLLLPTSAEWAPVTRTATAAGHMAAGGVPRATATRTAVVVGFLTAGGVLWVPAPDAPADFTLPPHVISVVPVLLVGIDPDVIPGTDGPTITGGFR